MQLRDPRVNGVLECELVPPPWPRPSLNGGAVQLCALQWKKAGEGERRGERNQKAAAPPPPKARRCSLICAQKGRRRPKPNKLQHTTTSIGVREEGRAWRPHEREPPPP